MQIQPTRPEPGPAGKSTRRRAGEVRPEAPAEAGNRPAAASVESGRDQVKISGAARELSGILASQASRDFSLDPARERQVLDRIRSGFYNRADVRSEVLRRLLGDLEPGPNGS